VCVCVCACVFVCVYATRVSATGFFAPHNLVGCENILSKCFSYCFYNFVISDASP